MSRASLAYAARKADETGTDNVQFLQADILDVAKLERRFRVIESLGVLHHMADPMAGWRALISRLEPDGLMLVGLYSELGRTDVAAMRAEIAARGLGSSDDDIRRFRRAVLDGEFGTAGRSILRSPDFYTMSDCRDLLFHEHEVRHTLPELQTAMALMGLEFLGFQLPEPVLQAYRAAYPDDPEARDLANWHAFETAHPETFRAMYRFWCRNLD